MLYKIREFNKNYSNIVFLIIMIFILVVLIITSINNRNKPKECVIPSKVVGMATDYSYDIKVLKDDVEIAKLFVKKYDSKHLIELNKDDEKNIYFLQYTDFLRKNSNGTYSNFGSNELIEGLDNKYILFEYINDLSMTSDIITRNDRNCYINRKENVSICVNMDNSVELTSDEYTLIFNIKDKYIDDFDVVIEKLENYDENVNE
ncbi:MAG: hypothetical protein II119_00055 [Bacilli bacterium]|nr:hypothetical protein [Bacilli bacterium]MBQ6282106.1 hypothetical protein [Bacilli bacterium]